MTPTIVVYCVCGPFGFGAYFDEFDSVISNLYDSSYVDVAGDVELSQDTLSFAAFGESALDHPYMCLAVEMDNEGDETYGYYQW